MKDLGSLLAERLKLKKLVREAQQEELSAYSIYEDRKYKYSALRKRLTTIDAQLKQQAKEAKEGEVNNEL